MDELRALAELRANEAANRALLLCEYRKLLALLAAIRAGSVNPASVRVDLVNDGWAVEAPVPAPPEPGPAPELAPPLEKVLAASYATADALIRAEAEGKSPEPALVPGGPVGRPT